MAQAIAYLKEKRCPPETFIPLDTIRAKPVREALRQLGGTKVSAQDVITAPEKFGKAVQFSVSDAIICDGLDEARQLGNQPPRPSPSITPPSPTMPSCRQAAPTTPASMMACPRV